MHLGLPDIGLGQVGEALVRAAEVRHVDQVNHACKRREVRQRMLRALDRVALNFLRQRTASAKLATGRKLDVDFAVGGVLDVLFQIKLKDRIAARRAQDIGRGQRHGVFGSLLALALFLRGLRHGRIRPQHARATCHHRSRKATGGCQFQKVSALCRFQVIGFVDHFVLPGLSDQIDYCWLFSPLRASRLRIAATKAIADANRTSISMMSEKKGAPKKDPAITFDPKMRNRTTDTIRAMGTPLVQPAILATVSAYILQCKRLHDKLSHKQNETLDG